MSPRPRGELRLALCAVTGLALVLCSAVTWLLPRSVTTPATGLAPRPTSTTAVAAHSSPCDQIVGPARAYCATPGQGAADPAALSGRVPSPSQGLWLVGFSTAALTAAIGLIVTAGGRGR